MPLYFGTVARLVDAEGHGGAAAVVLAEHAAYKGNFSQVNASCLGKVNKTNKSTATFGIDEYHASYLASGGLVYGLISGNDTKRSVAGGILRQMETDLRKNKRDLTVAESGGGNSLQMSFGPKIKQLLDHATAHPEDYDKLASVQQTVQEVQGLVIQNVDKVIERGENIEVIQEKAEDLQTNAATFQKTSKDLERKLWYQNAKMKIVFVVICLVVALVVIFTVLNAVGAFQ